MSDDNVLTKNIAEQYVEDEYSVELGAFTGIENDATESFGKHNGEQITT